MINSTYSISGLKTLARRLDRESNCTPCHSENVANYAAELCKALQIRGRRKDAILTACLVHDVGKISVDREVWLKKGRLSDADWHKIKQHPALSATLAQEAGCDEKIVDIIYCHHMWYNGNGYPHAGKKGQRIPVGARILSVCDAYDAMISKRPYREPVSREEALGELKKHSISQFDPNIVEVFEGVLGIQKVS